MTIPGSPDVWTEHDKPNPNTEEQEWGDVPPEGELLTLDEPAAAALAVKLFSDQRKRPDVAKRLAQWEVNRLRREGCVNVKLQKLEGQGQWKAYVLPGQSDVVPVFNKLDDLCEKITDSLLVDEPKPEPVPASGEDEDIEAAEFAERVLLDVQSEGNLDELKGLRTLLDLSHTYSRAFRRYWVDPQGSRGPVQILAAAEAVSADSPFSAPAPVDPLTGMPAVDPMTGQPAMVQIPPPYVLRYVSKTGQLTDNRAEAAEQWLPALRAETLNAKNVRFLPALSGDIWDAEGVAIGLFRPLAELRSMFPEEFKKLDPEELKKLVKYRPKHGDEKDLWPDGAPKDDQGSNPDDKLVWTVAVYYKQCAAYPTGAYICTAGENTCLHRMPWVGQMPDGTTEPLDLPVTEFLFSKRGRPDPVGTTEILGPPNELRDALIGHFMQYLDDFANKATFIPSTSQLRSDDLESRNRKYFTINPGGEPSVEDIGIFPKEFSELFAVTGQEMDTNANLQQLAQGLEDSSVKSGAHAREIRSAALVLLSGINQAIGRAYTRGCRIQLQLIRWMFSKPQQIAWVGEDAQHRVEHWTNADLKGTRDVRLKKGSLTMLSATAKAQDAVYYSQIGMDPKTGMPGVIDNRELREILTKHLGADIGLQDDPHRLRILRSISAWQEGAPEGYMGPPPPVMAPPDPMTGQPQVDPMTGQPAMQQPPDPAAVHVWSPNPADMDPEVANVRYYELKRAMASGKYLKQPPEWRAVFDGEFERMRQAAGVATVQEQQMAAQQQQQQEFQLKREALQIKSDGDKMKQDSQNNQLLAEQNMGYWRMSPFEALREQTKKTAEVTKAVLLEMAANGAPRNEAWEKCIRACDVILAEQNQATGA